MSRNINQNIRESLQQLILPMVLVVAVMASAIGGIYAKHEARKLFTELQRLNVERDGMEVEWGQLQIEQSMLSTYARVELRARKSMKMRPPAPDEMVMLGQ